MNNNPYHRLESNLKRVDFNQLPLSKDFSLKSFNNERYKEWLKDKFLPKTRLIIQPDIKGYTIDIFYKNGVIVKAFNSKGIENSFLIRKIIAIPSQIPIKKDIHIRGVLYGFCPFRVGIIFSLNKYLPFFRSIQLRLYFCAFQIINSDQNHYNAMHELESLGFEIPDFEIINYINHVDLYRKLWKEGKLFKKYPTNGILVKVNSKKLQKLLGENNVNYNTGIILR